MESPHHDLFSKDPVVLARMADEIIAELKSRLATFDAEQNLPLDRLHNEIVDASERGRWERVESLEDQFSERRDVWLRAREPMIQEIMRIVRAKEMALMHLRYQESDATKIVAWQVGGRYHDSGG